MTKSRSLIDFLGRAFIAGIFIGAGIDKIRDRDGTKRYMKSKSMPDRDWLLDGAIAVELGVAPLLALGVMPRFSASALAAFLVPTTIVFHDFWNERDAGGKFSQTQNFMKNLAIIGGLMGFALRDAERARIQKSGEKIHALEGDRPGYLDTTQSRDFEAGLRSA